MKFWKTGKIVKAISEADYHKLQRSRGRSDPGPTTAGPSNPGPSKPPIVVSDSDSDGPLIPLGRKRKKFFLLKVHQGPIRIFSPAHRDPTCASTSMERLLRNVVSIVEDVKTKVDKAVPNPNDKAVSILKEIFTCLVCKQVSSESSAQLCLHAARASYAAMIALVSGYPARLYVPTAGALLQLRNVNPSQC